MRATISLRSREGKAGGRVVPALQLEAVRRKGPGPRGTLGCLDCCSGRVGNRRLITGGTGSSRPS